MLILTAISTVILTATLATLAVVLADLLNNRPLISDAKLDANDRHIAELKKLHDRV